MGAASRITRGQIAIIGSVLIVIVAAGIFFGLIRPLFARMTAANAKYDTQKAIADQRAAAEEDQRKAEQEVAEARNKWRRYDRQFMNADINIENLLRATQALWREQNVVLGPKVTRFLRADSSVFITQANIAVPAPPTDPNQVNTKVITLPLGNVSVIGSFNSILRHAERWNRFDRLMLVDGLTLAGNSPRLAGQYSLTCYIFTRGETPGEAIPQAGGGQGGFGGGFPGGGGPEGFPGGPGGFPGGPEGFPGGPGAAAPTL